MKRVFFGQIVFALLLIVAASQLDGNAQDLNKSEPVGSDAASLGGDRSRGLEGTWQAQTMTRNCQTGTVMESFSKLVSFSRGGTAQEVSSSTLFRTAGLGIWERNDDDDDDLGGGEADSFRYLLRFFRFNPDGTTSGSVRAIWNVTPGPGDDAYTAEATIQI